MHQTSRQRYSAQQARRAYCVFQCVYHVAWDLFVLGSFLNTQSCFYFYSSASHRGECTECPHIRHPGGWFSFENITGLMAFHETSQPYEVEFEPSLISSMELLCVVTRTWRLNGDVTLNKVHYYNCNYPRVLLHIFLYIDLYKCSVSMCWQKCEMTNLFEWAVHPIRSEKLSCHSSDVSHIEYMSQEGNSWRQSDHWLTAIIQLIHLKFLGQNHILDCSNSVCDYILLYNWPLCSSTNQFSYWQRGFLEPRFTHWIINGYLKSSLTPTPLFKTVYVVLSMKEEQSDGQSQSKSQSSVQDTDFHYVSISVMMDRCEGISGHC